MRTTLRPVLAAASVAALLLAGCGSGSDAVAADDAVASLVTEDPAADDTASAAASADVDAEAAALAFTACMRDAGIDLPDPTVDADGAVQLGRGQGEAGTIDREAVQAARQTCGDLLEGVALGGGRGGDREAFRAELEETVLGFTTCLRDEGVDVGDLQLGEGGGGPGAGGARPDPEAGVNGFLANLLGLDLADAGVEDAFAACEDQLADLALPGGGGGGGRGGAAPGGDA